jgi:hypothetical protein
MRLRAQGRTGRFPSSHTQLGEFNHLALNADDGIARFRSGLLFDCVCRYVITAMRMGWPVKGAGVGPA